MDKLETILTLMRLPGVGPARVRRALASLSEAELPIEEAFSPSGRRLLTASGVSPSAPQEAIGHVADRLRDQGVQCLVAPFSDLALSPRARKHLPPVLFAAGPVHLIATPSVGFCGSRAATSRGLEVAADIAQQVSAQGFNVVSGGAKGAHRRAERALSRRPWLAGRAMQRNRTICALSRAMVLIEARASGGTFAAGQDALAMRVPLFTADYGAQLASNDGNRILLERGGVALRQSRATGRANLAGLFEAVPHGRPFC